MTATGNATSAEVATGRPGFVADLAALYYEPRIKVEEPVERFDDGYGRHWRRCWVWFLDVGTDEPRNHNIHINQYRNGWWELGIGCHCTCKQLTIRYRREPTDDEAREALRLAGWPGSVTSS